MKDTDRLPPLTDEDIKQIEREALEYAAKYWPPRVYAGDKYDLHRNELKANYIHFVSQERRRAKKTGWVSVKMHLPEIGQGVLVAVDNGAITIAYRTTNAKETRPSTTDVYSSDYAWQLFGDVNVSLTIAPTSQITHWQPLPAPPATNLKTE